MINNSNTKKIVFDTLFTENYSSLVSFINSYVNNRDESLDIVQNAFVKLWEQGDFSKDKCALKSFLYTVAKNYAFDLIKHRKVKMEFADNQVKNYKLIEQDITLEALRNFNSNYEKKIKRDKVRSLILKLPFSDRKIFIMSKYNNLTNNEIADILNISPKTVEKRIKLSLLFIRERIVVLIF